MPGVLMVGGLPVYISNKVNFDRVPTDSDLGLKFIAVEIGAKSKKNWLGTERSQLRY